MASVQTNKIDGRYLKLTVTEESTSIENNTSTVRWLLESIGGNSNYYNVYSVEVKINNSTVYGPTTKTWDSKVFPAAKGSTSGTVTINHNPDGTADPLPFSLRGSVYNNNPQTYSDNLTLSTIPRASSITVSDANIGSATNIVINKASNSFTTTLKYRVVGESNWREPAIVTKTSNQVYGWTVPTSLYTSIPSSKTIQCEFQATTYSGDTQIGSPTTTTATFTATGNPTIGTRTATDVNSITAQLTTGSNTSTTKMVKYASNVQISVSATAQNSAYISSITVNGNNVSLNGTSTSTTRSGTYTFNGATTNTFTIVATDSRGYTTTNTTSNTLTMINYIPLTLNATIERNQPTDGKIKISYYGNYYDGEFSSNVNNTLKVYYRAVEKGQSFANLIWTELLPTINGNSYSQNNYVIENDRYAPNGYDYTKQYEFQILAEDRIQEKRVVGINIPKGKPIFNWADELFNINGNLKIYDIPLIETNSNANGNYIKFADGTLIQWGNITHNVNIQSMSSTSGLYYQDGLILNLPTSFVNTNYSCHVQCASNSATFHVYATRPQSSSRCDFDISFTVQYSANNYVFSYIAIGRWK
jgi:hypothetical protein